MKKKTIKDIDVQGKRVLMRVDFNVPVKGGVIRDDTRIRGAVPTIKQLLENGASVVLMSHMGRPQSEDADLSQLTLAPVAADLSAKLGIKVKFVGDCVGADADAAVASLQAGEVLLLENLRFHAAEEGKGVSSEDQEAFAKQLAAHGDVYVNDAFGTAHRAHASMAVVTKYIDVCAAGLLLEKELEWLGGALENPAAPFVAIMGGKKVSDKIKVIEALLPKVDKLLIGGAMAYVFSKASGGEIGDSFMDPDDVPLAKELLAKAGDKLVLPTDNVIADDFSDSANTKIVAADAIPAGWEGLDIGPETTAHFMEIIKGAKTVIWNGPMGVFEMDSFAKGTNGVSQALADNSECITIIGGGDSVAAVNKAGLADKMSHVSTGGGASLEFMEGKVLPGLAALTDA